MTNFSLRPASPVAGSGNIQGEAVRILAVHVRHQFQLSKKKLLETPGSVAITGVPAILWSDGSPWPAACAWLAERARVAQASGKSISGVQSDSWALLDYARFLEKHGLHWDRFPFEIEGKPTYRFRGELIRRRRNQTAKSSTVSNRMNVVVRFYVWALANGLIARDAKPFGFIEVSVTTTDRLGVRTRKKALTTDIAIPNRSAKNEGLEDGLFPVTRDQRDRLIAYAKECCTPEFSLMLQIGFYTGMRIGTIVELTRKALSLAFPSRELPDHQSIAVGPDHGIKTKGDVNYFPSIPNFFFDDLLAYATSERAVVRRAKAESIYNEKMLLAAGGKPPDPCTHEDRLFLNKNGEPYDNTSHRNEISNLRNYAALNGLDLPNFYFHCSRATFGTLTLDDLMAKPHFDAGKAVKILMRLMGHRLESSTWDYISFREDAAAAEALDEEYAAAALGNSE